MLYRFTGESPEIFPSLVVRTPTGQPRAATLLPGDVVEVVTVDGHSLDPAQPGKGCPVLHRRLEPADDAARAATADLAAWVEALDAPPAPPAADEPTVTEPTTVTEPPADDHDAGAAVDADKEPQP